MAFTAEQKEQYIRDIDTIFDELKKSDHKSSEIILNQLRDSLSNLKMDTPEDRTEMARVQQHLREKLTSSPEHQNFFAPLSRLIDIHMDPHNKTDASLQRLVLVVKEQDFAALKLLQSYGLDINAPQDQFGHTLLHFAEMHNKLKMVEYLIDVAGADVNAKMRGHTALHMAARSGDLEIIKSLVIRKADINAQNDGKTPLHVAAEFADLETCKLLVSLGANINLKDIKGFIALDYALNKRKFDIAKWLVDECKIFASKWTALHMAAKTNNKGFASYLLQLEGKPNVNAQDANGRTPLHIAASNADLEMCKLLVDAGANINAKDAGNLTPLTYASRAKKVDVVEYLSTAQTKVSTVAEEKTPAPSLFSFGANQPVEKEAEKPGQGQATQLNMTFTAEQKEQYIRDIDTIFADEKQRSTLLDKLKKDLESIKISTPEEEEIIYDVYYHLKKHVRNSSLDRILFNPLLVLIDIHIYPAGRKLLLPQLLKLHNDAAINLLIQTYKLDINAPLHMITMAPMSDLEHAWIISHQLEPNWTALHLVAKNSNKEMIKYLLKHKANINAQDADGRTPLHLAAQNADLETCQLLVSAGADINAKDARNFIPLNYASQLGKTEIVKYLNTVKVSTVAEEKAPASVPVKMDTNPDSTVPQLSGSSHSSSSPKKRKNEKKEQYIRDIDTIFDELKKSDHKSSEIILNQLRDSLSNLKMNTPEDRTEMARVQQHLREKLTSSPEHQNFFAPLSRLIDIHIDPHNKTDTSLQRLVLVVKEQDFAALKLLQSYGLDINAPQDQFGHTLLHFAAMNDKLKMVEYLIDVAGADVNAKMRGGNTALHLAAMNSNLEIIKSLVIRKADINAQNNYGETPLYGAAEFADLETCKLLVSLGADINLKDIKGFIALDSAVKRRNFDIAKWLVDECKIFARKWTALHMAAKTNNKGFASYLLQLEGKPNVNAQDANGRTPLHIAASNADLEMCKLLVDAGANINAKDAGNLTPLTYASRAKKVDVVEYLSTAQTKVSTVAEEKTPAPSLFSFGANQPVEKEAEKPGQGQATQLNMTFTAEQKEQYIRDIDTIFADEKQRSTLLDKLKKDLESIKISTPEEEEIIYDVYYHLNEHVRNSSLDRILFNPLLVLIDIHIHRGTHKFFLPQLLKLHNDAAINLLIQTYKLDINAPLHMITMAPMSDMEHAWITSHQLEPNWTALHLVAKNSNKEMIKYLLKHRANINAQDADGRTPLHLAAQNADLETCQLLVSAGADINAKDARNFTPLNYASQLGKTEIVKYLNTVKVSAVAEEKAPAPVPVKMDTNPDSTTVSQVSGPSHSSSSISSSNANPKKGEKRKKNEAEQGSSGKEKVSILQGEHSRFPFAKANKPAEEQTKEKEAEQAKAPQPGSSE